MTTCFIDIDGVLADFATAALRLHNSSLSIEKITEYGIHKFLDLTPQEFWNPISAAGFAFWRDLPPYPWMRDLWIACNDFAPTYVCTTPSLSPSSSAGKHEWIIRHLDTRRFVMTPCKETLAAPGHVLIDDYPINCEKFAKDGGDAILFRQPWNAGGLSAREIIEMLRSAVPQRRPRT